VTVTPGTTIMKRQRMMRKPGPNGRKLCWRERAGNGFCRAEREGRVAYRYGKDAQETERMDYLEFIARRTSHIIDHLKLTFVADKPPPAHLAYQEILVAVETGGEYFS
jgi:hypothetical protein